MGSIQRFSESVSEKLGYYVYSLRDPRDNSIFYIGKGVGNRIFEHLNAALARPTSNEKLDTIRAIHDAGLEVIHFIHRHGLSEKEAFEVEAALIDFVGLAGLTNQVHGYATDDRGLMSVVEVVAKYQAPLVTINEPSILITVNRLYRRAMGAGELYEITRGNWWIGERRKAARYAFAVYRGVVREVYRIDHWEQVTARRPEQKHQKRWRFEGRVAIELQHYVGGSVEQYSTLGAQNPIHYVNC